jgi:hypothetical protein
MRISALRRLCLPVSIFGFSFSLSFILRLFPHHRSRSASFLLFFGASYVYFSQLQEIYTHFDRKSIGSVVEFGRS